VDGGCGRHGGASIEPWSYIRFLFLCRGEGGRGAALAACGFDIALVGASLPGCNAGSHPLPPPIPKNLFYALLTNSRDGQPEIDPLNEGGRRKTRGRPYTIHSCGDDRMKIRRREVLPHFNTDP
jgi:hypothetical protein